MTNKNPFTFSVHFTRELYRVRLMLDFRAGLRAALVER